MLDQRFVEGTQNGTPSHHRCEDQHSLLEAMEQQTVSIAKAPNCKGCRARVQVEKGMQQPRMVIMGSRYRAQDTRVLMGTSKRVPPYPWDAPFARFDRLKGFWATCGFGKETLSLRFGFRV